MPFIKIMTDPSRKELASHGSLQFPLEINHDHLHDFYEHYIQCHWHEELEIPVVVKGSVCCQLKDQTFELNPGEGIVINTRIPHSMTPLGKEEPVLITTIFHPSLLYGTPESAIYQQLLYPYLNTAKLSGILLSARETELLLQADALYEEAPFGFELQIKSLLCSLFFRLLSGLEGLLSADKPSNDAALSRLAILLNTIHEHYDEPLSLSDLAAQISLSREGCCRFFKSMTGKTIFQYLEDYRVSRGILLLQEDRFSITQIAYLVGFGNPGRFSAAFDRRMHCTPRQYRRQLQAGSESV